MSRLEEKIALITGADSGIGRAVAIAYAREGADVAIAYLNEDEDAKETERLVREAGRHAVLLRGDISDDAQCARIVDATVEAFGRIDILVNNAAFQGKALQSFEDLDAERVQKTLLTNVGGLFNLTRRALPHMHGGGVIINTASINAYQPKPPILDYAHSPLGRPAQPAELAPAYVFLASDESRFVTGEILGVTGGGLLA